MPDISGYIRERVKQHSLVDANPGVWTVTLLHWYLLHVCMLKHQVNSTVKTWKTHANCTVLQMFISLPF